MYIANTLLYDGIDYAILQMMREYLANEDIDKIYKEWNFWDAETDRISNKKIRFTFEVRFIGRVLTAVSQVQPYGLIDLYLNCYKMGDTSSLLSFVLNNVQWTSLNGIGKKLFKGPILSKVEEHKQGEEKQKTKKKDKKQELLEKVQQEIKDEYPAFKEVFYEKYRDSIASMVFNLNGNVNDSELLERLIEDEMIEDFSNFKIKQIENLLKNS